MSFVHKSVNEQDGIGFYLRELRERAGFSRVEASVKTKILESTIRSWEEDLWDEAVDAEYSERIFRSYIKFLGGNEIYFVNKYRQEMIRHGKSASPEEYLPRVRNMPRFDIAVGARMRTLAVFILFVFILVGYVVYQVRAISVAPPLEVMMPKEGERLNSPRVHVTGKTIGNATVLVNDRDVVVQPDGTFNFDLDVPRGTTVIIISAKKRHGRSIEVTRHVVYER